MEGDTTDLLRQHKTDLDRVCAGVMPDTWEGHGRLAIRESDAVPSHIEEATIEKMNKIVEQKSVTPERAANALISKLAEKQE